MSQQNVGATKYNPSQLGVAIAFFLFGMAMLLGFCFLVVVRVDNSFGVEEICAVILCACGFLTALIGISGIGCETEKIMRQRLAAKEKARQEAIKSRELHDFLYNRPQPSKEITAIALEKHGTYDPYREEYLRRLVEERDYLHPFIPHLKVSQPVLEETRDAIETHRLVNRVCAPNAPPLKRI